MAIEHRPPAASKRGRTPAPSGRDVILKATYETIRDHGYHQVTVADICKRAGVVRATFYVYFANKLDAFMAMMEGIIEGLYETAGLRYPDADEYGRIVLGNVSYFQAWARHREVLADWFALALVDEEVQASYERFRARFEDRIEGRLRRLMDAGRIPETDSRMLAATLSGMVETFVRRFLGRQWQLGDPSRDFPVAIRVISEAWYRIIYAKQPPAFDYSQYSLSCPVAQSN
jgi:AcrR family transcriptional regulator